jgi:Flp pilus assembly protein TadD
MNGPTYTPPVPESGKPGKVLLVLFGLSAVVGLVFFLTRSRRGHGEPVFPMDSDPRLTFATPYRNVRPEVAYTGDEACTSCHATQAETFRHHPMGRSLTPVATADALERYDSQGRNPFQVQDSQYLVERRGARVFHRETHLDAQAKPVCEKEAEIRFVLGSGHKGRAYLIDHGGYLFQSPISWYSQKGVWDLAPGYESHNRHFGRMVQTDCLFCHSNRVEPVPGSFNHYREPTFRGYAIGCERCHGPGALHVALRQHGEPAVGFDNTIVNPAHLEPALREAVCQQCHLQGDSPVIRRGRQLFDYRPGLPLHLFVAVFVRPPELTDNHRAVSHVQQMYASRCFQASQGQLGCISCHDPHVLPAREERAAYYRSRCLSCHTETSCTLAPPVRRQKNKEDACTSCHMPRTGNLNIAHTAETDHHILRETGTSHLAASWSGMEELPLIPFHTELADPKDGDAARDLGLALISQAEHRPPDGLQLRLVELAFPLLKASVRHTPDDAPAQHALAIALRIRGEKEQGLAALEMALATAPRREVSLVEAAALAAALGRDTIARDYWQRALAVNPWSAAIHAALAKFLGAHQRWDEAVEHCQKALQLDPSDLETRMLAVRCYRSLGQQDRARAEFDRVIRFQPPIRGQGDKVTR